MLVFPEAVGPVVDDKAETLAILEVDGEAMEEEETVVVLDVRRFRIISFRILISRLCSASSYLQVLRSCCNSDIFCSWVLTTHLYSKK